MLIAKEEYSIDKLFLAKILVLADMAAERDADSIEFVLGSADGIKLSVEMVFKYTKEQENGNDDC